MTGCKIIKNRLTRFIFVLPLRGGLLLVLGVVRVCLGFGLGPGLFLGTFLAFGFGSPGCRLFAFVLPRLNAYLPSLFGGQQTALYERSLLFGVLKCLSHLVLTTKNTVYKVKA